MKTKQNKTGVRLPQPFSSAGSFAAVGQLGSNYGDRSIDLKATG